MLFLLSFVFAIPIVLLSMCTLLMILLNIIPPGGIFILIFMYAFDSGHGTVYALTLSSIAILCAIIGGILNTVNEDILSIALPSATFQLLCFFIGYGLIYHP